MMTTEEIFQARLEAAIDKACLQIEKSMISFRDALRTVEDEVAHFANEALKDGVPKDRIFESASRAGADIEERVQRFMRMAYGDKK